MTACCCEPSYVRDELRGHTSPDCPLNVHGPALRAERDELRAALDLCGMKPELLARADIDTLRGYARIHADMIERDKRRHARISETIRRNTAAADPSVVAQLARSMPEPRAVEPAFTSCPRCHQVMVVAGRCASCDTADHDQGDQLGMFDIAPTPVTTAKRPLDGQEGLF